MGPSNRATEMWRHRETRQPARHMIGRLKVIYSDKNHLGDKISKSENFRLIQKLASTIRNLGIS
jgi:hypothetical protein